jgi:peptide/nickel transport system substrate-binding protein
VSNGLFVPGSPYYSKTTYPAYNPTEAKKLVAQVKKAKGASAVAFTLATTNDPNSQRGQAYLQQAWEAVGFKVTPTVIEQNALINTALAGKYEATTWRQFGAVDPDLNYIFWSSTTVSTGISINMARNDDPQIEAALQLGRTSTEPSVREKAYSTVNKRLAIDLPYLWTDRAVWAVVSNPTVQNWNNPKTPAGAPAFGMIGGSIWPTQIWIS